MVIHGGGCVYVLVGVSVLPCGRDRDQNDTEKQQYGEHQAAWGS
jgi:hypothetical protein